MISIINSYIWTLVIVQLWMYIDAINADNLEPGALGEFCRRDTFQAACPVGQVIVVDYAKYGQMHVGKCVPHDHDGCSSNVQMILDQECSGRRQCTMRVTDGRLMDTNACPDHVQPFLEVAYSCVSVISGRPFNIDCRNDGKIQIDNEAYMTIPSSLVYSNRYGSNVCSWVIEGKPGQKVNVTMQDFGLLSLEQSYKNGMTTDCHKYATLVEKREGEDDITHDVCGGPHREKNIYLSEGHSLEIQYPDPVYTGIQPNYLLKVAVLGCPDPEMNGNIFQDRDGDRLALYCESTEQTSYLHCRGRTWSNEAVFCKENKWPAAGKLSGMMFLGIFLGCVFGLGCMGTCYGAYICHRRRKMPEPAPVLLDEYYSSASSRSGGSPSDNSIAQKETAFAKTYGKNGQKNMYQMPMYERGQSHPAGIYRLPTNGNQKPAFMSTSNLYAKSKSAPADGQQMGPTYQVNKSKMFDPNARDPKKKQYFAGSWTRVNDDVVFIEGPNVDVNALDADAIENAKTVQIHPVAAPVGPSPGGAVIVGPTPQGGAINPHAQGCMYGQMMTVDERGPAVYGAQQKKKSPQKSPTKVAFADKQPPNYLAAVHYQSPGELL